MENKVLRYSGKWFLPNGKIRLPGELDIDNQNNEIKLRIFSNTDFKGNQFKPENNFESSYKIIHGYCKLNSKVTLIDCECIALNLIGDNYYEYVFKSSYSYSGGLFENPNSIRITRLSFTIPYLSSFYDTNRIYYGNLNTDNSKGPMEPAFTQDELVDSIKINETFKIDIERRYVNDHTPFSKIVSSEIKHFAHISSTDPISLFAAKEFAQMFMQLIKLSIGKLIHIDYKSAVTHKNELQEFDKESLLKDDKVFLSINNFHNLHKRKLNTSDYIHQRNMLFCGGRRNNEELKSIIKLWFDNYDRYGSIYNIFLDSFEWFQNSNVHLSDIMFNNRLVNLVQGIENYYYISENVKVKETEYELKNKAYKILESIPLEKDIKWMIKHLNCHMHLREKLKDLLLNKFDMISSEIFKNKESKKGYIHKIKEFRDNISHGEKGLISEEKIPLYYYRTLIILITCILDTLNFSQSEIKENLFRTLKYSEIIHYIKSKI